MKKLLGLLIAGLFVFVIVSSTSAAPAKLSVNKNTVKIGSLKPISRVFIIKLFYFHSAGMPHLALANQNGNIWAKSSDESGTVRGWLGFNVKTDASGRVVINIPAGYAPYDCFFQNPMPNDDEWLTTSLSSIKVSPFINEVTLTSKVDDLSYNIDILSRSSFIPNVEPPTTPEAN
ncbi:MAG: hypothetical protein KKC80_02065 [Candidatus Margulisbacteria bacterium]|nr:hypothetical protein [Candidatus Margulisiibacteriota bacterium]MBU1616271.1 hypothetical protein [Candidatus Margulisiibacteriota bacterium]MBU1867040.1 hypothetical protein [Candidatus Margulisiibacteriota bacterium]